MTSLWRNINFLNKQFLRQLRTPEKIDNRNIKRWVAPTLMELKRRRERAGPEILRKRSAFLEWNYSAEIFAFAKRLNEEFDEKLLRMAFIHRSYIIQQELNQKKEGAATEILKEDNSQLIDEGKLLIQKYLQKELSKQFPEEPAEKLYKYLTTDEMLSLVGKHIGLTDLIFSEDFPVEKSTLARTFEAVIGALKNSTGTKRTELFLKDFLLTQLNDKNIFDIWVPEKPYEYLNKIVSQLGYSCIEPRLCNQSAVNTILANFQVGLYSDKKLLGLGWGESIEIAKDTAALDAIYNIQIEKFGHTKTISN